MLRAPTDESWVALSDAMDAAVGDLIADAPGVAAIATGGYGRRQLCLFSDIDLMLVVPAARSDLPPVFRALWDAGLAVGHAVRTPAEAAAAARESFDTACSLLDVRFVGGDRDLADQLAKAISGVPRLRTARTRLAGEERDRRSAALHHLQAVNLKTGRGGLRALQAFPWLEKLGDPSAAEMLAEARTLTAELLAVRQSLHAAAGRADDTASVSLRQDAARWSGEGLAEWMARLNRTCRSADRLLGRLFGDDLDTARRTRRRRARSAAPTGGPLAVAACAADVPAGELVARLSATPVSPIWDEQARDAFVRLAGSGPSGRRAFDALADSGHLDALLPEWARIVALPQIDPFHLHPLDDHLWRTAHEVAAIPTGEDPWLRQIANELGDHDDLVIAALFHDIGKGTGRDHSEAGAEIAAQIVERAGFGDRSAAVVTQLIGDHLLLPRVATRQDLNDPEVVRGVSERITDPDVLRMLYLLTIADGRATGPEISTPWWATLVRTLFVRAMDALESRAPAEHFVSSRIDSISSEAGDGASTDEIARHLRAMPDSYVMRVDGAEVRRHLALLDPPPTDDDVRIDAVPRGGWTSAVVVVRDRPGLLSKVSGVMALSNVSIVEARLATRDDGSVVDQFGVIDSLTGTAVDDSRWETITENLSATLAGELDLRERLRTKHADYASRIDRTVQVEVLVQPEPDGAWQRIEVRCPDRVGLLHDLTTCLFDLGIDVAYAKIDTRGPAVHDTFHVRRLDVSHATVVDRLARAASPDPV